MRAKLAQENLIKDSEIPYSIVRATQFFEFVSRIADAATDGNQVRVPPAFIQPIAADDVATAVTKAAIGTPLNGMVEIAGPQRFHFDELIRQNLAASNDSREVIVDPGARYFGVKPGELGLVAAGEASLGAMRFENWLTRVTSAR